MRPRSHFNSFQSLWLYKQCPYYGLLLALPTDAIKSAGVEQPISALSSRALFPVSLWVCFGAASCLIFWCLSPLPCFSTTEWQFLVYCLPGYSSWLSALVCVSTEFLATSCVISCPSFSTHCFSPICLFKDSLSAVQSVDSISGLRGCSF